MAHNEGVVVSENQGWTGELKLDRFLCEAVDALGLKKRSQCECLRPDVCVENLWSGKD